MAELTLGWKIGSLEAAMNEPERSRVVRRSRAMLRGLARSPGGPDRWGETCVPQHAMRRPCGRGSSQVSAPGCLARLPESAGSSLSGVSATCSGSGRNATSIPGRSVRHGDRLAAVRGNSGALPSRVRDAQSPNSQGSCHSRFRSSSSIPWGIGEPIGSSDRAGVDARRRLIAPCMPPAPPSRIHQTARAPRRRAHARTGPAALPPTRRDP